MIARQSIKHTTMPCSKIRQGGTLLIELLLGMTLLVLIVMAVFALFPMADRAAVNADRATQALQFARRLLNRQMAKEYENLEIGEFEETTTVEHSRRQGVTLQTTFNCKVSVTQPDPARELKRVQVSVRWERGQGETEDLPPVTLESIKGRLL